MPKPIHHHSGASEKIIVLILSVTLPSVNTGRGCEEGAGIFLVAIAV
jgi:hypothetical protein